MSNSILTEFRFWTTEEENLLRQLTGSMSFKDMARLHFPNRTAGALQGKSTSLRLNGGFHPTLHSHNIDFWKNPNQVNSFFAGYIAADGNLNKSRYNFRVQTAHKDIKIIKDLKDAARFTGDLAEYNGYPALSIAGCSEWYKDLAEIWSITPAKTFTLQPPKITNDDLIKCFLIGFICGDGWVSYRSRGDYLTIGWCGASLSFMEWMAETLNRLYPIHERVGSIAGKLTKTRKVTGGNHYISIIGNIRALRILNDLSKFNVPKLDRKFNHPEAIRLIEKSKQKYPHLFLDN